MRSKGILAFAAAILVLGVGCDRQEWGVYYTLEVQEETISVMLDDGHELPLTVSGQYFVDGEPITGERSPIWVHDVETSETQSTFSFGWGAHGCPDSASAEFWLAVPSDEPEEWDGQTPHVVHDLSAYIDCVEGLEVGGTGPEAQLSL